MFDKIIITRNSERSEINKLSQMVLMRQCYFISAWLYFLTILVFCMVIIGGLTRLTDSGLSMVEWRPFTGWLPPLSNTEWLLIFEQYKATPEYIKMNLGMSLNEFKDIFWLEYLHRLWGRMMGVCFAVPFTIFVMIGWINFYLGVRLLGILILASMQGVLGWYMVQSGLVDHPDVSHYRLAAHLGLALVIIAALFWIARGVNPYFIAKCHDDNKDSVIGLRRGAILLVVIIFITSCSGALVAGLNAGLTYNTFPLMDGQWIPEGLFAVIPWYMNFFENVITVQFDHRILAMTSGISVVLFWLASRRYRLSRLTSLVIKIMFAVVIFQIGLGVSTLLMTVPVSLAIGHQGFGVVLFICSVWVVRELTPSSENMINGEL